MIREAYYVKSPAYNYLEFIAFRLGFSSRRRRSNEGVKVKDEYLPKQLNGMKMANDPAAVHVDHGLGDIGAMIADPLQVLGNHNVR